MPHLTLHTLDTAPEASRTLLQSSIDGFGWIPNQSAYMAESPGLLEAYQRAHELFLACPLDPAEKAVVWITAGTAADCPYTVGAHRHIALASGVPPAILRALVDGEGVLPPRLLALKTFTEAVLACPGRLGEGAVAAFLGAGFTPRDMLDVILGVSQKRMSTLLNGIAGPELDDGFRPVGART